MLIQIHGVHIFCFCPLGEYLLTDRVRVAEAILGKKIHKNCGRKKVKMVIFDIF